jgi:hypothetical protein
LAAVRVEFRVEDARKRICRWDAVRGKRTRVPGTVMGYGNGPPHDLVQYVVEAATNYQNGFWGLVASGATFKSTGRRRTKPGRALIATHRAELAGSEVLAGTHVADWKRGKQTHVTAALNRALQQWQSLGANEALVFDWPSPTGRIEA